MWSELDQPVIDFIKNFEEQLGEDDDMNGKLPLDNLQININLDQRSNPPVVSWNVTIREGANKIYNIGCTNPEQLEQNA